MFIEFKGQKPAREQGRNNKSLCALATRGLLPKLSYCKFLVYLFLPQL
jgi:hypothetical protein